MTSSPAWSGRSSQPTAEESRPIQTPDHSKETKHQTTNISPELEPHPPESDRWPTPDRDPADNTRDEPEAHSFDPPKDGRSARSPTTIPPRAESSDLIYDDRTRRRRGPPHDHLADETKQLTYKGHPLYLYLKDKD